MCNSLGGGKDLSIQKRRIGYYNIYFARDERQYFDKGIFRRLLEYIDKLPGEHRIIADDKTNKAVDIESIKVDTKQGSEFVKMVFKSCKYNHSPNYMSSLDGTERATDKKLSEGEKEITHMCMRLDLDEAYTIFEERRTGVSMYSVINFFNKNLIQLCQDEKKYVDGMLSFGYIPSDKFLDLIEKSQRIVSAELFVDRTLMGSQNLNLLDLDDSSRDDVVITIKAQKRKSLLKNVLKDTFNKLATEESRVNRIRLYAKDKDNFNMYIDTDAMKKVQEINVELKEDGTVDTYSIFSKMEEIFGVNE